MMRMLLCIVLVWLAAPVTLAEQTEVEAMIEAVMAPSAVEDPGPFVELPITKSLGLGEEEDGPAVLTPLSPWHGFMIASD